MAIGIRFIMVIYYITMQYMSVSLLT